ncbi:MAG: adenylyltransferase/cytidyltransferase family protein [Kiritimatiellaeota bacterium]|nr:adenylyltransferase/cytidyltransferase family protein [Kiritimatiellota bacterium]
MHSQTDTSTLKIIPTDQWQAWRKNIANAGGTVVVVTGSFALWHPGNLAAIREAARQASHVCVIITPASPALASVKPTAEPGTSGEAMPSAAVRLEMAAHLRNVSMATTCSSADAKTVLAKLRPYTLVECTAQKIPGTIATVARKLANHIVDLAPVAGCFTADIQKAIQDGRTPVSVPDAAMAPQPNRHDLDRFLDTGATGKPLVTVNGCFDVLHLGHVRLLAQARNLGARLLVLVNDDDSVRAYKGTGRPVFPIRFRLHALNALDAVAMAYPFSGDNPLPLLATIRPDIHVKGGSFEEARVREERRLVESWGGRLEIIPLVEGFSTSGVVSRMTDAGRQIPDTSRKRVKR